MKVAIVGSGIAGLTAAYRLQDEAQISVFEKNSVLGGHTATFDTLIDSNVHAIDTGFIVYNDWTYPRFIQLLDELGVDTQPTDMGFSVTDIQSALEYAGTSIGTLFTQKRNLISPGFLRMIWDIVRFNRLATKDFHNNTINDSQNLNDYLISKGFGRRFRDFYILPMASAIWSASTEQVGQFNALFFIRFFVNHGLLNINRRPQWRTITGGSRAYIEPLSTGFKDLIQLDSAVTTIKRHQYGVELIVNGDHHLFDHVILACHSDEALAMLEQPSTEERRILSGIPYEQNSVIMHTDTSLLPKNPKAWSSWNYLLDGKQSERPVLTYNMNILQNLDCEKTVCVTVNGDEYIDPDTILSTHLYAHPQFGQHSVSSQADWSKISGHNRTWYCGAYWRNGFHEDGVFSAERVIDQLIPALIEERQAA